MPVDSAQSSVEFVLIYNPSWMGYVSVTFLSDLCSNYLFSTLKPGFELNDIRLIELFNTILFLSPVSEGHRG
jgi:hypothetical protein